MGLHLWLVLRLGINEWPMPGRLVDRETYRKRYEAEVAKDGVPFFPDAARKDMVCMGVVILAVLRLRRDLRARWAARGSRSHIIDTAPKPDFYFLCALRRSSRCCRPGRETTLILLVGPPVGIVFLAGVPFLAGTGEKSWRRRPVAVLGVVLILLTSVTLSLARCDRPLVPGHGRVERRSDARRAT